MNKGANFAAENQSKVRFPLALKLSLAVTAVFFVCFSIIILLSWFFVHSDVDKSSMRDNANINNKAAAFTALKIKSIYQDAVFLLEDSKGAEPSWQKNKNIAAMIIFGGGSVPDKVYINDGFFSENNLDLFDTNDFIHAYVYLMGTDTVLNASEFFNNLPVLTMSVRRDVLIFFLAGDILDSFVQTVNESVLLNKYGDVLGKPGGVNGRIKSYVPFLTLMDSFGVRDGYYYAVQDVGLISVLTTISQDVVFESINNTTLRNIYISLDVWFISILIMWFFSFSINTHLLKLKRMAERIENGEYHLSLAVKNRDETGHLTDAMNKLSTTLGNFEKFTNRTIARLARTEKLSLGGEDKNATLFFSDIRSFTAISEKMPPDEVVSFLNDYMERMVSCVLLTGGVIDKFIGDAIMAHWGAVETTGSPEEDAVNGVCAALLMRAALASFNEGRGDDNKNPIIKIGCGLNSGSVVAGLIGTEDRVEFTVIGDAVSFADKCETFNKSLGTEIIISENTYNLVGDKFIVEKMPGLTEDGKKIYAVINIKDPFLVFKLFEDYIPKIPKINIDTAEFYIGSGGPQTLDELRKLLDIPMPDLKHQNINSAELKYEVYYKK